MTPEELKALPETTVEQAKQIKRRCQGLLDALSPEKVRPLLKGEWLTEWREEGQWNRRHFMTTVGCPHCQDVVGHCNDCVWPGGGGFQCVNPTFNGISLRAVRANRPVRLEFGREREYFICKRITKVNRAKARECIRGIRAFLDGHVEWADLVIEGKMT